MHRKDSLHQSRRKAVDQELAKVGITRKVTKASRKSDPLFSKVISPNKQNK